jgi:endonuclease YncB( thermonuclease family)
MENRPPTGFVWSYPAFVDEIKDGDTFSAHVYYSRRSGQPHHEDRVRLEGINAIEESKQFGGEARDELASMLAPGSPVLLFHRKREKYGGLLARVIRSDGIDVCAYMLTCKASDGTTPLAVPMI